VSGIRIKDKGTRYNAKGKRKQEIGNRDWRSEVEKTENQKVRRLEGNTIINPKAVRA